MLYRMLLLAQNMTDTETFDHLPINDVVFQQNPGPEVFAGMGVFFLFFIFWMVFCLAISVVTTLIPLWIICKKAGLSPYMSLLIFVPGINIAFYWILALLNWPNLKPEAEHNAYNFFGSNNNANAAPPKTTHNNANGVDSSGV